MGIKQTRKETIQAWIARDEDGRLCHYSEKPGRILLINANSYWDCSEDAVCCDLPEKMFPEITWDDEPRKVEISIKLL